MINQAAGVHVRRAIERQAVLLFLLDDPGIQNASCKIDSARRSS
jgi:hypothetical protein